MATHLSELAPGLRQWTGGPVNEHDAGFSPVNSLGQTRDEVRQGFREAAEWFVTVTEQSREALDEAALGVWSVRDLIGHTSRAVTTVESYLTSDTPTVEVPSAVAYYRRALAADPEQIAERGRQAGQALGNTPAQTVARAVERVTQLVDTVADDARLNTAVGVMLLREYLPTRTFELTVHTCDLVQALNLTKNVPLCAATAAARLGAELAVVQGRAAPLLLAITGRTPLPEHFSVVQRT